MESVSSKNGHKLGYLELLSLLLFSEVLKYALDVFDSFLLYQLNRTSRNPVLPHPKHG